MLSECRLDLTQIVVKTFDPLVSVVVIVAISSQIDIVSVGLDVERVVGDSVELDTNVDSMLDPGEKLV